MPDSALPPHLQGKKHWDWPKFLQWVPRGWTAVDWGKPKKLLGNQPYEGDIIKPIGSPKTWQISYYPDAPWYAKPFSIYMAYSGKAKDGEYRHYRIGARFDDVDSYTNLFALATRKFPIEGDRDTSTL